MAHQPENTDMLHSLASDADAAAKQNMTSADTSKVEWMSRRITSLRGAYKTLAKPQAKRANESAERPARACLEVRIKIALTTHR